MAAFSVPEMVLASGGVLLRGVPTARVRGVCTDSRLAHKGEVFLALQGEDFDGHQFIDQVVACGVGGLIIDERYGEKVLARLSQKKKRAKFSDPFVIGVEDTLVAYQELAAFHRRRFERPVIAITGSNGKTTTKEMVARALGQRWTVLKTEANFNNRIGVPRTLLRLDKRHDVAVIEMGVDAEGQTSRLCEIAKPTLGVITNIGPDHLEFFGDLDGSARAKAELLRALPKDGSVVLNAEDPYFPYLRKRVRSSMVSFGFGAQAQFRATSITRRGARTTFRAHVPGQTRVREISLRVHGEHNVLNALSAMAVSRELGLSMEKIGAGLASFRPVDMRSRVRRIRGFTIIEDCYNANPASMKAALDLLNDMKGKGQTIAVLGDMLELGTDSKLWHWNIGTYVSALGIGKLITCGSLGKEIGKGARAKGMSRHAVIEASGADGAARILAGLAQKGDLILLKASRGMRLERVLQYFPPESGKHDR